MSSNPEVHSENRAVVWFALVGGGVAWTLHLLLAYAVAEFGCLSGLGEKQVAGFTMVTWMLLGVSLGAAALAASAILVSRRMHCRLGDRDQGVESTRATAFSARLGYITNVVFGVVIVVQTIPIFYFLRIC